MNLSCLLPVLFFPFIARALIVTLNELGHAIPGLLFTKKKLLYLLDRMELLKKVSILGLVFSKYHSIIKICG